MLLLNHMHEYKIKIKTGKIWFILFIYFFISDLIGSTFVPLPSPEEFQTRLDWAFAPNIWKAHGPEIGCTKILSGMNNSFVEITLFSFYPYDPSMWSSEHQCRGWSPWVPWSLGPLGSPILIITKCGDVAHAAPLNYYENFQKCYLHEPNWSTYFG